MLTLVFYLKYFSLFIKYKFANILIGKFVKSINKVNNFLRNSPIFEIASLINGQGSHLEVYGIGQFYQVLYSFF